MAITKLSFLIPGNSVESDPHAGLEANLKLIELGEALSMAIPPAVHAGSMIAAARPGVAAQRNVLPSVALKAPEHRKPRVCVTLA